MLKRSILWILPLMVILLIATYFVLSPIVAIHAAGPVSSPIHHVAPNYLMPQLYWRH